MDLGTEVSDSMSGMSLTFSMTIKQHLIGRVYHGLSPSHGFNAFILHSKLHLFTDEKVEARKHEVMCPEFTQLGSVGGKISAQVLWRRAWAVSHTPMLCDSKLVRTSVSSFLNAIPVL